MNTRVLHLRDLELTSGEPRLKDVRIGERLGMSRPRDIRATIETNRPELERYGAICGQRPQIRRRGRPETAYWLNEGQTLLLCMFSRTSRAADVRQEVIEVFLAWRGGANNIAFVSDGWNEMRTRLDAVEKAIGFQRNTAITELAQTATYLPIWQTGRRPDFWRDIEVREFLTTVHRQMTLNDAMGISKDRFGPDRTPSRSSIQRFWARLDQVRGIN